MPDKPLAPKSKVPFIDWLLFVTNFTWAFGIYRLMMHPAANPEERIAQQNLVWFGLIATVIVFGIRIYLKRNTKTS